MADVGEVNIIPVELAVQRELAYRRHVAMLQSPSNSNFIRNLKPLEVQSIVPCQSPRPSSISCSSPRLSGIKRQAPVNRLESLPASKPHGHENPTDCIFCKICQVPCSGFFNFKQHINGKKHKLKLQELKFDEKNHEKDSNIASLRQCCKFCGIWCMNEDNLKVHFEGQKDKNAQANVELASKNGKETVIRQNCCELCNIWCCDENALQMHFHGKSTRLSYKSCRMLGKQVTRQRRIVTGVKYAIFGV